MQFKAPFPATSTPDDLEHRFDGHDIDTEVEIPVPKPSSYTGMSPSWYGAQPANWHDGLPKPRYQRDLPVFREPIDLEKMCYRVVFIAMGIAMLITLSAFFGKLMIAVFALKIVLK